VVTNHVKSGRTDVVADRFRGRAAGSWGLGTGSNVEMRQAQCWAIVRRRPKEGEMAEGDWWYDLKTHTVVPDNNETKITDRLGPYKTREEAERALELVEERNEAYDNDPRWNDDL
jgi:hypothetical protein